ncbi:hypothetical protein ACFQFS_05065 [Novosphingobium lubricantis]
MPANANGEAATISAANAMLRIFIRYPSCVSDPVIAGHARKVLLAAAPAQRVCPITVIDKTVQKVTERQLF